MWLKKRIPISEMANLDIELVNKENLIDVSGFTFDNTVQQSERAAHIVATVKNPYCFRLGNMGVKLEFSENAPPLQDVFANFLKRKKSGL